MRPKQAIVLSPSWPGTSCGYELAVQSSLATFAQRYESVVFVVTAPGNTPSISWPGVEFIHLPVKRSSKALRFVKSLPSSDPAITRAYRSPPLLVELLAELQGRRINTEHADLICEDIPISVLAGALRRKLKFNRFILRSHNVVGEAFEGFDQTGSWVARLAWRHEIKKIARFERESLNEFDEVWTITHRDLEEYRRRYAFAADGVLPVALDRSTLVQNADSVEEPGNPHALLHLGTLDLRKGHGMRRFIEGVYSQLRRSEPDCQLVLGGRNSKRFDDPAKGVSGLGFVRNEEEFMRRGKIFINPQRRGTGVKLKSLMAMSYGRVLVTTPKGIEGIEAVNGEHCFVASNDSEMASIVLELMNSPEELERVGRSAHNFVIQNYCRDLTSHAPSEKVS